MHTMSSRSSGSWYIVISNKFSQAHDYQMTKIFWQSDLMKQSYNKISLLWETSWEVDLWATFKNEKV